MPAPRGVFALLASLLVASATVAATTPPSPTAPPSWPASGGLLLAGVMTGGASASDEYVEIANAGAAAADLGGCELVYVTASGATLTRKAAFTSPLLLAPGQHLLVANAAGIYGALADATYSGGLAADGGAVALRRADGTVVDAVGWGAAANAYVEGSAAPAPPVKSSIERLPGGSGGNTQDTNDNSADWFVQPNPVPQSLSSRPAPSQSASPSMTATDTEATTATPATPSSTPPPTPGPTGDSTATATTDTTASPTPTGTVAPATTPTPTHTAAPTAPPTASNVASASPSPTVPPLESIATARAMPAGTRVHVAGLVTAGPGLVGSDTLIAIQDSSGGAFVHLSSAADGPAIGANVDLIGALAAPYGQVEIRDLETLTVGADAGEPVASNVALSDIGENTEGSLVTIGGAVSSVQTDGGRVTITVVDGTSTVHVLADPPAGVTRSDVVRGDVVVATGIVGQRATATGRLDGYRVWLRRQSDLAVENPIPTTAPTSEPLPSGAPVYRDLAAALKTRGAAVDFEAAVTATAGLLDIGGPTVVVDDGTTAVAVVLPDGANAPRVGMRIHVVGKVGRWESGPTVLASSVVALGDLQAVTPREITSQLGATLEWRLVRLCGRIERFVRAGARWRVDMLVGGHEVSVLGEPVAAIDVDKSSVGRLAVVTGIVRRATSDSSAFQLLPRTSLDFRLGPAPDGAGMAAAAGSAGGSGDGGLDAGTSQGLVGDTVPIESLSAYLGQAVTVSGLVTATTDSTATINDGTGEVRLGGRSIADVLSMLEPGDAIEVTGVVEQDGEGLLVEASPDSVVDVPGARDSGSGQAGSVSGAADSSSMRASAAPLAASASMPRTSSVGLPPVGLAILAAFLLAGALASAAVVATRRGAKPAEKEGG